MSQSLTIALATLSVFVLFVVWYGGRGKPLQAAEAQELFKQLESAVRTPEDQAMLNNLRSLAADDDGREFVMQNMVKHRVKALYPPGHHFGDDPREADRRYGRAVIGPLLRYGNLMLFVAPRAGHFVRPADGEDWTYVAMVRYRSLRDFLRFAIAIEKSEIVLHKWAAIEKTQIFPVKPLFSLIMVRTIVGGALASAGMVLNFLLK